MPTLRSANKVPAAVAEAVEVSTVPDLAVDLSGPVAAAKNRASRNISIAKSKVEMEAALKPKESMPTQAKEEKAVVKRRDSPKRQNKKSSKKFVCSKTYTFPFRLYDMITMAERDGLEHIIGFNEDGDQVVIRDGPKLAKEILPLYFGHSNMRSFDRQCSYWGFQRLSLPGLRKGIDQQDVVWAHHKMRRGERGLVETLFRTETKQGPPSAVAKKRMVELLNKMKKTTKKIKKQQTKSKVRFVSAVSDQDESAKEIERSIPDEDTEELEEVSQEVSTELDSMRTVSPSTTDSVLQITAGPSPPLDTATRRVSDSSLTVLDSDMPATFALPFIPEDALDAEEIGVDIFPEISVDAVMATEADPLDVNPVYLVDEDEMSDEDDDVSLLSINDIDGPLNDFHDDMDHLTPYAISTDDQECVEPSTLTEFRCNEDTCAAPFLRNDDGQYSAFAQV